MDTRTILTWLRDHGVFVIDDTTWITQRDDIDQQWAHTSDACGVFNPRRLHTAPVKLDILDAEANICLRCINTIDPLSEHFHLQISRLRIALEVLETVLADTVYLDPAARPNLRAAALQAAWRHAGSAISAGDMASSLDPAVVAVTDAWRAAIEDHPLDWEGFDAEVLDFTARQMANIETRWTHDNSSYQPKWQAAYEANLADTQPVVCFIGSYTTANGGEPVNPRPLILRRGLRTTPARGIGRSAFAVYPNVVARWLTAPHERGHSEVSSLSMPPPPLSSGQWDAALLLWEDSFNQEDSPHRDFATALHDAARL